MDKNYCFQTKKEIITKKEVLITMAVIAVIPTPVTFFIGYWWIGILISVAINYWYLYQFYPSTPVKRARKIMKSDRVNQTNNKAIPCPTYFIGIMAGRNRELRRHNQTYRWFLTTTEPCKSKDIKIIKIEGKDCWFFMQDCYSQSYVEEAKKTKEARREQRAKQKTAIS
jgi:hypothetical protein